MVYEMRKTVTYVLVLWGHKIGTTRELPTRGITDEKGKHCKFRRNLPDSHTGSICFYVLNIGGRGWTRGTAHRCGAATGSTPPRRHAGHAPFCERATKSFEA
jgi:hypothetical protein